MEKLFHVPISVCVCVCCTAHGDLKCNFACDLGLARTFESRDPAQWKKSRVEFLEPTTFMNVWTIICRYQGLQGLGLFEEGHENRKEKTSTFSWPGGLPSFLSCECPGQLWLVES